jgi:hypothetical protein
MDERENAVPLRCRDGHLKWKYLLPFGFEGRKIHVNSGLHVLASVMVKTHCINFMCQREPEAFWMRWWRDKSSELSARLGSCVYLWLGWWSAAVSPFIPGFDPRSVNKVSLGQFCPSTWIYPVRYSTSSSYSLSINIHISPTEYSLSNWRSFSISCCSVHSWLPEYAKGSTQEWG